MLLRRPNLYLMFDSKNTIWTIATVPMCMNLHNEMKGLVIS